MEKIWSILVVILLVVGGVAIVDIGDETNTEPFSSRTEMRVNRVSHVPIRIDDDLDFASQASIEGWSGNGSDTNPYIIENYDIDAEGAGNAIYIGNTTVYFIIRNCELYNTSYQSSAAYSRGSGITLYNVQNGRVENNILRDNPDDEGIYLEQSSYNTLFNNTVFNNYYGITLYYSINNEICENNISSSASYGIYFWNASNNDVLNNTVSNNGDAGIRLYEYSSNNLIKNNTIASNSGTGLYIQSYCVNNTIELNDVLDSGSYGIYIYDYSDWNYLSDNFINNSFSDGIHVFACTNTTIEYNTVMNTVNGAGIHIYWYAYDTLIFSNYAEKNGAQGVWVESYSDRAIVEWNTLVDNGNEGVYVSDSSYTTVTYNVMSGSTYYSGLKLYNSAHNTVEGNEMYSNYDCGIYLLSSSDTNISYNTVYENRYGIYLEGSTASYIYNNTVYSNTMEGISLVSGSAGNEMFNNSIYENGRNGTLLDSSDSNTIYNNTIQANAHYGMYLHNSNLSQIYRNDFIGNGIQAYDDGDNSWNLTYPGGGNYWSDYNGSDIYSGPGQNLSGSDGFGDIPYNITGGLNMDYYPIMGMQITLEPGWNLISVPWQRDGVGIEGFLAGISWDRAMGYYPYDGWYTHDRNRAPRYNLGFPVVDNTAGIWVNITANCTLNGPSKDLGNTTIWLITGWNLVGYPSNTTRTVGDALAGVPYTYVQTYDRNLGDVVTLGPTDLMEPGKGYWIYVTEDWLWTIAW